MLSVFMLSVISAECHNKPFMLSVIMLNVVMLSVVTPYKVQTCRLLAFNPQILDVDVTGIDKLTSY